MDSPGNGKVPERESICEVGRRLYQRGLCSGFDGNLSLRLDEELFLCTPTGMCKGFLGPDDLCLVDRTGTPVSGFRPPTSELAMHLAIYRVRDDVRAVVHFHPPCASAFAITGRPLPAGVLAEAEHLLGDVPIVPYGRPGGEGLARVVAASILPSTRAMLLANHGAVTFAGDLWTAWSLAESLETFARIALSASLLGDPVRIPDGELTHLRGDPVHRPRGGGAAS